ncbi:MAG: serine hydrolase [Planctomycetales bacterium]|nr:serine hydrolase [Planctomycetales bacterium]
MLNNVRASCRSLMRAKLLAVLLALLACPPHIAFGQTVASEVKQIAALLEPLIESHQGDVAVALRVLDEQGQLRYEWNYQGERVMPTASLIKLPIMIEAYRQIVAGTISLDDPVQLTEEDKVPGSGILTEHFSPGAVFKLRDAIRLMIRYSDNTATNLVIKRIGLPATSQLMVQWQMPETQLHSLVYRRDTSIAPDRSEKYGLGSTTALDMVQLLTRLQNRQLVSEQASMEMREHLLACEARSMLPLQLPADCAIAHKSGAVNRSRTDAGIVSFSGGSVVLCVLTDNNADTSWSADNAAQVLGGTIAKKVYDFCVQQHGTSPPPPDNQTDKTLTLGATGLMVESLQRTLNDRLNQNLSIDGDFGPATQTAVRQFQSAKGLSPTGIVDSGTWQALGELITHDEPVAAPEVVNAEVIPRSAGLDPWGPPAVTAKAWVAVDGKTGRILGDKEPDCQLAMASTTKVMTAYLILELAMQDPKVLDEVITFSQNADDTIGSTSSVRAGEQLPAGELLYGLLLPSGNDASVALAEHFGGRFAENIKTPAESYSAFVDAMNAKAVELGLANTHFVNPHGLTEEKHFSSATDLAKLAAAGLRLPGMRAIVSCQQRGCRLTSVAGYSRNVLWKNTNQLLSRQGFVGMKTGTTTAAGACLIGVGTRGDSEIIVVLLGSASSQSRYVDAENLFAWAWRLSP